MRKSAIAFVLIVGMSILLVRQRGIAAEASRPSADPVKEIEQVLAGNDPDRLVSSGKGMSYTGMFRAIGADGRHRLLMHRNDSIAIQAGWGEVALTVPEKEGDHAFQPDRDKLNSFLGFLEGRTRIQPPKWWSQSLLDCRANRRNNIYFLQPEKVSGPNIVTGEFTDVIRVGDDSFRLPWDLPERLGSRDRRLSALLTPTRCFVAVHIDVGYPFPLACFDRASEKLLWKSQVWGTWWFNAEGPHGMSVSLAEQSDRILVFGISTTGLHVEAFRSDNGKNLFRFCTSYAGY